MGIIIITVYKDKNKNGADNGIIYGVLISSIIFGVIALNYEQYIDFMNMSRDIYKVFCIK